MKKIIPIVLLIILIIASLFYGNKHTNKLVFSEPSNDNDSIIAAYIYGELSTTFPTTNSYLTNVECLKPDGTESTATGAATWNGTKWEVSVTGIVEDGTTCNVYFERVEPRGWTASQIGSLLYAIKSTGGTIHDDNDSGMTYPARDQSTTNEGLRKTEDDYGISYYYRGAIDNNYLVFANMCWRILRVDGAGNIRIILYNYNPNNVDNPCATSEDGATNSYARYNNVYQTAFNTNTDKNTYVGFMYSNNPNSAIYDIAHANDVDSTILTFLKNWYDQKLRTYNDMLADVIWCNDKSVITDTTFDPWNFGNIVGSGLGTDLTYYSTIQNHTPYTSAVPSLICPDTGVDGKLSKFTARDTKKGNAKLYSNNKEYRVGLITPDEVAFAGSRLWRGDTNSSYYLYKNASSDFYWTMTPLYFNGAAYNFFVRNDGNYNARKVDNSGGGVRPIIALKSTTLLDDDFKAHEGTTSYPFRVETD